eukprot:2322212-Pleurochrysis_carterae.AAC.1
MRRLHGADSSGGVDGHSSFSDFASAAGGFEKAEARSWRSGGRTDGKARDEETVGERAADAAGSSAATEACDDQTRDRISRVLDALARLARKPMRWQIVVQHVSIGVQLDYVIEALWRRRLRLLRGG